MLLSEVSINTASMKDTIQELRKTLKYSNQLTEQLQDKIDIYKETLNPHIYFIVSNSTGFTLEQRVLAFNQADLEFLSWISS